MPPLIAYFLTRTRHGTWLHGDDRGSVDRTYLVRVRHAPGRTAAARQGFDESIPMMRRLTPHGWLPLCEILWRSGIARFNTGETTAALPELQEATVMAETFLPSDHARFKGYREKLARRRGALAEDGKPDAEGGKE